MGRGRRGLFYALAALPRHGFHRRRLPDGRGSGAHDYRTPAVPGAAGGGGHDLAPGPRGSPCGMWRWPCRRRAARRYTGTLASCSSPTSGLSGPIVPERQPRAELGKRYRAVLTLKPAPGRRKAWTPGSCGRSQAGQNFEFSSLLGGSVAQQAGAPIMAERAG